MTAPAGLVDRFLATAGEHPRRTALRHGPRSVSYSELAATARRRASELTRTTAPGRVAIACADPVEQVSWTLASYLGGVTCVPLDSRQPAARLDALVDAARCTMRADGSEVVPLRVLPPLESGAAGRQANGGDDAAYLCYTSGSTGAPKGVLVPLEAITATVAAFASYLGVDRDPAQHVVATSWAFDVSMLDLWMGLSTGGELVLPDRGDLLGPALVTTLARIARPVLQTAPSLLAALTAADVAALNPKTVVVLGGESPTADLLDRLAERVQTHVAYGVTEAAVCSSAGRVGRGARTDPTWLGRPLPHVEVSLSGDGPVGELLISGAGVSLGYDGDDESTSRAFPLTPTRSYRTGDLVELGDDGSLYFRGRTDDQMTVRGHRVEPSEVERALAAIPGVRQAAVALRDDPSGGPALVAYLVGDVDLRLASHDLAGRLAAYMLPDRFEVLPELPLSQNGKVDRRSLPQPAVPRAENARPGADGVVADLWRDLLSLDDADDGGRQRDFVSSGGHSLKAVQMSAGLRDRLGIDVPASAVLTAGSLDELVTIAAASPAVRGDANHIDDAGPRVASAAQSAVYLSQQLAGTAGLHNVTVAVRLGGPLDVQALETALWALEAAHPGLRTAFGFDDDDVVVETRPPGERPLRVRRSTQTEAVLAKAAAQALDIESGECWTYTLLRETTVLHTLVLTFHHAAVDGVSVVLLLAELANAYNGSPPEALGTPVDGSVRVVSGRAWTASLDAAPAPTMLPHQKPVDPTSGPGGKALPVTLSTDVARLTAAAGAVGVTLQTLALTGLLAALAEATGEHDLLVGLVMSSRRGDEATAIGHYSVVVPLRVDVSGLVPGVALVRRVGEAVSALLDDVPASPALISETLRGTRAEDGPQVVFAWDERPPALHMEGLTVDWALVPSDWAEWGLTVELATDGDRLKGRAVGRAVALADVELDRFLATLDRAVAGLTDAVGAHNLEEKTR